MNTLKQLSKVWAELSPSDRQHVLAAARILADKKSELHQPIASALRRRDFRKVDRLLAAQG